MADERYYQPQLVWGYFRRWLDENLSEQEQDYNPRLFVFRTDRPGAYRMHGPKLYWAADLGIPEFRNTDQDDLWEKRDLLGEVQGYCYRQRAKNPVQWNSFDAFIADVMGTEED